MQLTLRKKIVLGVLILVVLVGIILGILWVINPAHQVYKVSKMRPTSDVSDNLKLGPSITIFNSEISSVGYYTFLHGSGPYTIFAPTNKAYANLSAKDHRIMTTDKGMLRQILLYNIVEGNYRLSDLRDGMVLHTVQGDNITVTHKGNSWILNGYAYIQTADIASKNGVIHLTTNYLIPPSLTHH